jgi:hypothetical protein
LESWDRRFLNQSPCRKENRAVTLRDAANYITKLPKAEHEAPDWRAAMEGLLLVVEERANDVRADRRYAGAKSER